MPDYQPIDLGSMCNAGVDILGDGATDVSLGNVSLRGLPFSISEPADRCFVAPRDPVSLEIGQPARRVIVAHRLLKPGAPAGHAVGQQVAEYAFHLAGGDVVRVPIRERFEIQIVPPEWGREPFLAVTDTHDGNLPRFEGRWDDAGVRLAEHTRGWAKAFYLWCWENPHPDQVVERLTIDPSGPPFLVARRCRRP